MVGTRRRRPARRAFPAKPVANLAYTLPCPFEPVEREAAFQEPAEMAIAVACRCVERAPAPAGVGTVVRTTLDQTVPTVRRGGVSFGVRSLGSVQGSRTQE